MPCMKHIIVKVEIPISPLRLSIYLNRVYLLLSNPNDAPHSKAKKFQIKYILSKGLFI